MLKKIGAIASSMGALALVFFSQITTSGAVVTLEASDLSSISSGLEGGGSSLIGMVIDLFPYLIMLTVILLAFGWIKRMGMLKRK